MKKLIEGHIPTLDEVITLWHKVSDKKWYERENATARKEYEEAVAKYEDGRGLVKCDWCGALMLKKEAYGTEVIKPLCKVCKEKVEADEEQI